MTKSDSLNFKAELDLANRTRWSTLSFLAVYVIIFIFSSYFSAHPIIFTSIGVILLFGIISRIYLSLNFERLYQRDPRLWTQLFVANIAMLSLTWGVFCLLTIIHYQLSWTSMLVILATAGLAAGASSTLSIHFYQIVVQLSLMLAPPVLAVLHLGTKESAAISVMFLIYISFLLIVARRHHIEYWSALNTAEQLRLHSIELENSNRELESFSYSIAHDLRSPLRSIIGFTQILMSEAKYLKEEDKDNLSRVVNASKFMARLIDDILNLSRITRGKIESNSVNLSQLADSYIQQLKEMDPQHGAICEVEENMVTEGDPHLLFVALQNLIDNSWKFTHKTNKEAKIEIGTEMKNNKITYYVKDNGIGFEEKYSNKIFHPFERLNKNYEGTGIGLATVARVVHRHGGEIWAESKTGEGATFYFTL